MAEELFDVAEFWLPSDFVYDDLLLEADRRWKALAAAPPAGAAKSFLDVDLVEGLASNLDSPETDRSADSDEEDFLAGLTQRMGRSFLLGDDGKDARVSHPHTAADKPLEAAGSPQSTLCGWPSSKKVSTNCPSLAFPPPLTREEQRGLEEPWSLLSEAAGQVMRLKLSDLEHRRHLFERGLLLPQRKTFPAAPPSMNSGHSTGYSAAVTHPTLQQLRTVQFYRLKQLQLLKQQQQQQHQEQQLWAKHQYRANSGGVYGETRSDRPLGLAPSAWPPLQKQRQNTMTGSSDGMRAVFLNSAKKQCAGTGVFIPRTAAGKVNDLPRKKTVSSTVLVPTRVVQALNLNLEEFGAQPRFSGGFAVDHAALVGRNNMPLQNKLNQLHVQPPTAMTARDLRLPQEWSY